MVPETLQALTRDELYERAQEHDISGRSRMDKEELIAALLRERGEERDGADESEGDWGETREGEGRGLERHPTSNRSIWKGSISFGLITIPVALYSAVEDRSVSFHMLSADDGSRIRYKRVASSSDEEVDWDDIVKGFEFEKGRYVTFTREELAQIPSDSLRQADVVQFVAADDIDPMMFDRSYYVAPEPTAVKAYGLLLQALENKDRVGVAKVTIREKERPCVLRPRGGTIVMETMHWPDEIRIPSFEQLDDMPEPAERELQMAEMLIDEMTEEFDPARFIDSYRLRLQEAIAAKIEGEEVSLAQEAPPTAKVTDLMDALKASVEATRSERAKKSA